MDRLSSVLEALQRHAGSHPVLVAMWTEYIEGTMKECRSACEQAEKLVDSLPEIRDPNTWTQVAALCALADQ